MIDGILYCKIKWIDIDLLQAVIEFISIYIQGKYLSILSFENKH